MKYQTMKCPWCKRVHPLSVRQRNVEAFAKNKEFSYKEKFYFCEKAHAEYETDALVSENLKSAQEALKAVLKK